MYKRTQAPESRPQQNHIACPPMSGIGAQRQHVFGDGPAVLADVRAHAGLVAVVVGAGAALIGLIASGTAQPILLIALSLLAMAGAFFIFGWMVGHIHFGAAQSRHDVAGMLADDFSEALQLTRNDGSRVWSNKRFERILDRSAAGNIAALELGLGGTSAASEAIFRLTRAAQSGSARSEDVKVALANDALGPRELITWVRISVSPFQPAGAGKDKRPLVLWKISDITSERQKQAAAVAGYELQLERYETMPVGLLAADEDGAIVHMNGTLAGWLGLSDKLGASTRISKLADLVAADGAELLLDMRRRRRSDEIVSTDLDLVCEDGRLLPVRIVCQSASDALSALADDPDEFSQSVGGGMVIAVIDRREEEIDEATSEVAGVRFARFFRSAPIGIATIGRDGRITSTNAAFSRMIVDGTSGIGEPASDVLTRTGDKDTIGAIGDGLEKVLSGRGNVPPADIVVGAKSEFTRRVYMSPLTHTGSSSEAAILYAIDVTEQKALEAKFAQSQKMDAVGKLAGFVAHDFNNMLTAIIGFSDFLLQTHRPTDPAHADIMNIKSSANRAAGLVGKLLALARQQTLMVEPLQLGEVMTDLASLLKRSVGEKIELKLSSGRDLWYVKTDKLQLEQAVINLAVNARDAMPDGGRLTIRTRNLTERESRRLQQRGMLAGEYVEIEVSDTGTGIAPDVIGKIFEPFFTTKDVGKGTGLGLATVYGIVKQTGGHIYAESTVGEGTTFRIYLPRYHLDEKDEAVITERVEAKNRVQKADLTGAGRVLLVEDEDVVRSFAVRALTRQGYEVLEASDGLEALDVMAEQDGNIDIVVSDVVMPAMDGPTMLKEMRKTNPDIKIIFVSGYPNEAFQQALGEETFAFLPKPFSLPQLAAKVKEQLEA